MEAQVYVSRQEVLNRLKGFTFGKDTKVLTQAFVNSPNDLIVTDPLVMVPRGAIKDLVYEPAILLLPQELANKHDRIKPYLLTLSRHGNSNIFTTTRNMGNYSMPISLPGASLGNRRANPNKSFVVYAVSFLELDEEFLNQRINQNKQKTELEKLITELSELSS